MRSTAERKTVTSPSPPSTPRLRLQPTDLSCTPLDGAWWPRSADPVAELPGLILALDERHGPVMRVMLRAPDWDSHPRRLGIDSPGIHGRRPGRVVRLGWFDTMPAGLLTALHTNGRRTDLLIVPPSTSPTGARAAMELAARSTNRLHAPDVLSAITAGRPQPPPEADTQPLDIWESEGGRTHRPAFDRTRRVTPPGRDRRNP